MAGCIMRQLCSELPLCLRPLPPYPFTLIPLYALTPSFPISPTPPPICLQHHTLLTPIRWVYFTSGTAVLSLPTSSETATVQGGAYGLILAADTAAVSDKGHITRYPGKKQTIGLTIPVVGDKVPEHKVLHQGACTEEESRVG